jgi:hypothetical protein
MMLGRRELPDLHGRMATMIDKSPLQEEQKRGISFIGKEVSALWS